MATIFRLDWDECPKKELDKIKYITSYFVDILYNHLYVEAKREKINNPAVSTITEAYKKCLDIFIQSLSNDRYYRKHIKGIHEYFNSHNFGMLSFNDRMASLTQIFVPDTYFQHMDNTQRMSVLVNVIKKSVKRIVVEILRNHLARIIDYHKEPENVVVIQEQLINIFLYERQAMYAEFTEKKAGIKNDDRVDRALAMKMKIEIQRLINENVACQKLNNSLKQIILNNKKKQEMADTHVTPAHAECINQLKIVSGEKATLIEQNHLLQTRLDNLQTRLDTFLTAPPESPSQLQPPPQLQQQSQSPSRLIIEEVPTHDSEHAFGSSHFDDGSDEVPTHDSEHAFGSSHFDDGSDEDTDAVDATDTLEKFDKLMDDMSHDATEETTVNDDEQLMSEDTSLAIATAVDSLPSFGAPPTVVSASSFGLLPEVANVVPKKPKLPKPTRFHEKSDFSISHFMN